MLMLQNLYEGKTLRQRKGRGAELNDTVRILLGRVRNEKNESQ